MVTPSPLEVLKRTIKSRQAREGLLLVAILALAATLRLWRLGEVGFRGDEAVYGGQAAVLADADGMDRHFILTSRGNSNFLLFQYVVSLAYRLFGVSDVAARAVAATFSTLTVLVVFAIAKALYGRRTALYAALLMALSGYAVTLGRVALLESASVFLFAMAMLFVAWWHQTQKKVWLYGFAAAAALTIQAKVTGSIVIPIFLGYLVLSGRIRRVSLRAVAMSLPVFLAFLFPALVQLAGHHGEFSQFLSGTVSRTSKVPWYYYAAKLATFEGPIIPLLWAGSLLLALKRREGSDLLPVTWALGVLLFYQLYPLKGFNYLLPVVPPLSLLAARLLASPPLVRRAGLLRPPALRAGLAPLLVAGVVAYPMYNVIRSDQYFGLREAAAWLRTHTPPNAGVMALSQGSAQFALSFYGQRDAYPFGRFRLAAVFPGRLVVLASPRGDRTPLDWTTIWPRNLVESGTVSYFVYYTKTADDPPEDPLVQSSIDRAYRTLIEDHGGRLVHRVFRNKEARVWIYQVTKLLPEPVLSASVEGGLLRLSGQGFTMNSGVTVYYHLQPIARGQADAAGSISGALPLPEGMHPSFYLVVADDAGNHASTNDFVAAGA